MQERSEFSSEISKTRRLAIIDNLSLDIGGKCSTLDHDLNTLKLMKRVIAKDCPAKIFRSLDDWRFLVDVKFNRMC